MDYQKRYREWLENDYFDADTKAELTAIKENDNEIKERFYKDLEFGTAGLRGVIGAGTNRMNIYTVRKATQGLANYILKNGEESRGVAIAYDSRRMSPEFADESALCLAANGIKAYVFESLRPTPELSFAVRKLNCIAGINITASHNPPEYNGYKVYWEDGAQITPPHDTGIMAEVEAVTDYATVKTMSLEAAKEAGLYEVIGEAVDDAYMEELKKQVIHQDAIDQMNKDLKIVYSPLHGTGNIPVRRILKELGFENVYVVKEQELPDGNFPTVSYPNPEAKEAFELGLKLAKDVDADLVLATDPDADRLGVYVKDTKSGEYKVLTGNMSGCLLADYEISQTKAVKGLPKDGCLIKSIVTSNMAKAIAESYGVKLIDVLTGFKFIGQQILEFEKTGIGTYLFGFEESYGCLIGTYARDKDAIVATMALCEAAAYYKTLGKTLWDAMIDMYEKYGYYKDDIQSITLKGIEGLEKIQNILETLRKEPPAEIGGYGVQRARDYKAGTIKDLRTGETSDTGLPASNVLYYELENDAWVCVRPSGTEPKVKFYYGIKGNSLENADEISAKMGASVLEMIEKML
ncbi:MAG: phospho-sugar mutase [Faecalimonas umbilicata]|uniref:phospho-sugar mutase n=1 Tax=Faecalimonas umbilicata TaxID=1912855 RepID=UPI002A76218A|nr:phospho-sugar mutase [Faecalimonas umbilicata]MDY2760916.1 phospho-sugar mutase [Faecalimonas umbilicata]